MCFHIKEINHSYPYSSMPFNWFWVFSSYSLVLSVSSELSCISCPYPSSCFFPKTGLAFHLTNKLLKNPSSSLTTAISSPPLTFSGFSNYSYSAEYETDPSEGPLTSEVNSSPPYYEPDADLTSIESALNLLSIATASPLLNLDNYLIFSNILQIALKLIKTSKKIITFFKIKKAISMLDN